MTQEGEITFVPGTSQQEENCLPPPPPFFYTTVLDQGKEKVAGDMQMLGSHLWQPEMV